MNLDYLVLSAHPDDAELYCGGMLIKMREKGYSIGVLDLTRGEAGTMGSMEQRDEETKRANKILQPTYRNNLGLADGELKDDHSTRKLIVDIIRKHKVKLLIAPFGPCRHPDHTAVFHLARSVHFFSGMGKFPSQFPVWRPLKLVFHMEYQDIIPSFVVDISDQFERKMQMLEAYSSQFFNASNTEEKTLIGSRNFHELMIARFKYYGTQTGCSFGEPFITDGLLRIDDPLENCIAP